MIDLQADSSRRDLTAVLAALVYPTLLTVVYFILLAKHPQGVQQAAYGLGKTIQFLFPVVWVYWIQRRGPNWHRPRAKDLTTGLIVGLLLLGPALVLYFSWMKPAGIFDGPAVAVREKVAGMGIGSAPQFVAVAIFYCVAHSLLEEYYWRWFVFAQLRRLTSFPVATIVSSLGFMSHHVFVLAVYFGWSSPMTYFFSLAVAAGGVIWAWMYEKRGSLYGAWLSHALVDTAIFVVGYDLL
ncbi:MAG TPA: CPBP family intramembrane glutamic endopeptidase [Planctomycetaceae bacterium]|jgi:membrane protease YdiL (CAAX protease family)